MHACPPRTPEHACCSPNKHIIPHSSPHPRHACKNAHLEQPVAQRRPVEPLEHGGEHSLIHLAQHLVLEGLQVEPAVGWGGYAVSGRLPAWCARMQAPALEIHPLAVHGTMEVAVTHGGQPAYPPHAAAPQARRAGAVAHAATGWCARPAGTGECLLLLLPYMHYICAAVRISVTAPRSDIHSAFNGTDSWPAPSPSRILDAGRRPHPQPVQRQRPRCLQGRTNATDGGDT